MHFLNVSITKNAHYIWKIYLEHSCSNLNYIQYIYMYKYNLTEDIRFLYIFWNTHNMGNRNIIPIDRYISVIIFYKIDSGYTFIQNWLTFKFSNNMREISTKFLFHFIVTNVSSIWLLMSIIWIYLLYVLSMLVHFISMWLYGC